jgi:hypothetical protein
MYYVLEGKTPVPVHDVLQWGRWFESTINRHVADDYVVDPQAHQVRVSTVFLGLDHSFGGGDPVLFETMIFGGASDGYQERYTTWDAALARHQVLVDRVHRGESVDDEDRP